MRTYNVYEAKTQFSKLIEMVSHGEEIIIGKAGQPVALIIPYQSNTTQRKPGYWKGKIHIAKDFDELPEDWLKAFEGDDQ
ncbi:MAG: type II toxin-antitoxin system Phd/YefM family antitoxin [Gammaproteobacteria bacterium]